MVKVNAMAKQTYDETKAALNAGDRRKAERILRTASRQNVSLADVFRIALLDRKPAPNQPSPDAKALSSEIDPSSLTAQKAVGYAINALKSGQRSKADAIMRHAVHSGVSPADLAEVGLKNTDLVEDNETEGTHESEATTSSPVIDASGGEVTQSQDSNLTSEEETS